MMPITSSKVSNRETQTSEGLCEDYYVMSVGEAWKHFLIDFVVHNSGTQLHTAPCYEIELRNSGDPSWKNMDDNKRMTCYTWNKRNI